MPTLTKSSEDEHTKYFLLFIINSITVKVNVETSKQHFLENIPSFPLCSLQILKFIEAPKNPGLYIEYKCTNYTCNSNKTKIYGWFGVDMCGDITQMFESSICLECNSRLLILNIGLLGCKYSLAGLTIDTVFAEQKDMINYYTVLDELHFYDWKKMIIHVVSLADEEKEFLDNLVFSSFNDPTVPKKKYCKRKGLEKFIEQGVNSDIKANILSLEKEIRDLDSQIYELVGDNYKNSKLIQELKLCVIESNEA